MHKLDKILVLGATGMVGRAVVTELKAQGFLSILTPTHDELNLLRQKDTIEYFLANRPDYVFLAAAKVGGLFDNNTKRADYIFENQSIQTHVFQAAKLAKLKKMIFMASSCIYPKTCAQPMSEDSLLTGKLEETNSPFAISKLSGLILAEASHENWHGIISCSLYGEEDNFDPVSGHVLPGLSVRMLDAKQKQDPFFEVWGSGKPRREFLHVDDMARAVVLALKTDSRLPSYFNVGAGYDISISELAHLIAKKVGYTGTFRFDTSKEDGVFQKLLRSHHLEKLGWSPKVTLDEGVDRIISSLCEKVIVRRG